MNTAVYPKRKTFEKYDQSHIIAYLNEEELKDHEIPAEQGQKPTVLPVAYQYSGTESDGGTVLQCSDMTDRGELVNAVIHSKYSQSEEMAIHRHRIEQLTSDSMNEADQAKYDAEWAEYEAFCEKAKTVVAGWLAAQ